MNERHYSEAVLTRLRRLIGLRFSEIYADPVSVMLTGDAQTVRFALRDDIAASQNRTDEIIYAEFHEGPGEHPPTILVARDLELTDCAVARTVVYYSDHETYGAPYRVTATANWLAAGILRVLRPWSKKQRMKRVVREAMRDAVGGHEEFSVHPERVDWSRVRPAFANSVDSGVVLEFDDRLLCAFSDGNSFFLPQPEAEPFMTHAELKRRFSDMCAFTWLGGKPESA